jgi:3-phenylpropionate/trans-cinnamate dioxygenase ferredoxin reductase subunit
MKQPIRSVVVVGGGVAGGQAVQTLRAEGFDGRVALVGEERDRPYERPPLSKELLLGTSQRDWLFLKPQDWYADNAVELSLGVRAARLDPAGAVELDDGTDLRFDACILATGGRVRRLAVPGGDLDGVGYLRTLADSEALRATLAGRPPVVVVGAGFIGAEVASCARSLGCEVTMLEVAELPLLRVLGRELAAFYRDLHLEHGVDLRLAEGVESFRGAGRMEQVVGTSGRAYPAGVVVVGVGIDPADDLARDAGLRCDNGVIVDELCATSAPNVFAAGDVARFPSELAGGLVRVEHFQNAQRQGAAAARAVLGSGEPYRDVPWFWSNQYDVNLQMLGHPSPSDETVERGSLAAHDWLSICVRGGRVAGAIALNRGRDISICRRLIERRTPVTRDRLADETADLRELLR